MSTPTDSPGHPAGEPTTPYDGVPHESPYGAPERSWQDAYAAEPDAVDSRAARRPGSTTMRMAALVAAAAVAGGGVTYVITHASSSGSTAQVASTGTAGQLPGSTGTQQGGTGTQPGLGQGGPGGTGGFGGVAGEQRIVGTLRAVGDSSITVTTTSGTQTYQVSDATEIAQDGAPASLSDLTTGEVVLVHLVPSNNSSSGSTDPADLTVERIIAGTGGLGRGFGPGDDNGTGSSGSGGDATSTALTT
jgi:hypothetical protein